jgi:hypothetical protein
MIVSTASRWQKKIGVRSDRFQCSKMSRVVRVTFG